MEPENELYDRSFSVQQWWDKAHSVDHPNWLTGSDGSDVWRRLRVNKSIQPGVSVLNIGVGLGHCTFGLVRRGAEVDALDISPVALERVKGITRSRWLPTELTELPAERFDLAISHLVAQHMTDEDLKQQLSSALRSLKASGKVAIQIAYRMNRLPNPTDDLTVVELVKGGGICRNLYEFINLVESTGGKVTWAKRVRLFKDFGSGWYGVHIKKCSYDQVPDLRESICLVRTLAWEVRDLRRRGRNMEQKQAEDVLNRCRIDFSERLTGFRRLIFNLF